MQPPPTPPFQILGISHIGLAPKDAEQARWLFGKALGLDFLGHEHIRDQKTLTEMFSSAHEATPSIEAQARLELLIPDGDPESPIARFLATRGSGIHHLAISVRGIESAIAHLESLGVKMIDRTPRRGAHNTKIAFIHPHSAGGLLVELTEEPNP